MCTDIVNPDFPRKSQYPSAHLSKGKRPALQCPTYHIAASDAPSVPVAKLHAFLKTKSNRYTLCSPNIIRKYEHPKAIWFTVLSSVENGICKTNGAYLSEIKNISIFVQFFHFFALFCMQCTRRFFPEKYKCKCEQILCCIFCMFRYDLRKYPSI